jgi:DNA-binding CsgD family transcriptional regulator
MVEVTEIENLKQELIANWTNNFDYNENSTTSLPDYLKNMFLVNQVANQSNTIVQVFDMENFKTVYTSPNCIEITGFTDEELNKTGFTYWLRTIPLKQIYFYIKSAQFVNSKLKKVSDEELFFSNQCINLAFKNKAGENRGMVSTNSCIEWNGKKQKYQLILWRDMTEKFKTKEFSVRYTIGKQIYNYQSVIGKFKDSELITEKEFEMLKWIEKGISSKEIASELDISPFTVDNHKKNLLNKFSVSNMSDVLEIVKFTGII